MTTILAIIIAMLVALYLKKLSDDMIGITGFMDRTNWVEKKVRKCKNKNILSTVQKIDENPFLLNYQKRKCFLDLYQLMLRESL